MKKMILSLIVGTVVLFFVFILMTVSVGTKVEIEENSSVDYSTLE
ncbi:MULTISPECIES: hypothetical protein [Bacillaceae]|nr:MULTISPECIES: hypothetical protein [Bacillaceae]MDX8362137.1 hypothetical protein [Cytobacillus sp. IB215316]